MTTALTKVPAVLNCCATGVQRSLDVAHVAGEETQALAAQPVGQTQLNSVTCAAFNPASAAWMAAATCWSPRSPRLVDRWLARRRNGCRYIGMHARQKNVVKHGCAACCQPGCQRLLHRNDVTRHQHQELARMHCARDDVRDRRALNHRVAGLDSVAILSNSMSEEAGSGILVIGNR